MDEQKSRKASDTCLKYPWDLFHLILGSFPHKKQLDKSDHRQEPDNKLQQG